MRTYRSIARAVAAALAALAALAPATVLAADADASGPMAALSDFASVGLVVAVLAGWYGAAFALKRRSSRDR